MKRKDIVMKISNKLSMLKNLKVKSFVFILSGLMALSAFATPLTNAQSPVLWEGWTKSRNLTTGETEYQDVTNAKDKDVVKVMLWHHNRENPTAGPMAQNVKVRFVVPNSLGTSHFITGISSADNAPTISDTTTVNTAPEETEIDYIPGSAKFRYNKGAADGNPACETGFNYPPDSCYATVSIPDSVVTGGVNLDTIRGGQLRGCNAHHETVAIEVVVKKKETPPPTPVALCKAITLQAFEDRRARVSVTGQVQNAEIIGYEINWGDGSKSNKQTDEHQYASVGTYNISARVQVRYPDGTTEWKASSACTGKVTFEEGKPPTVVVTTTPPPTVTTVTTLPDTGAGEIFGIFTATSVAGAAAHRVFALRRRFTAGL